MSTSAIHIAQLAALERQVMELERIINTMQTRITVLGAKVDGVQYTLDKMPQVITQTPRGPGRPKGL